jgi:2-keto-3-deoxy-L-rhamnonate aldolase RhmA
MKDNRMKKAVAEGRIPVGHMVWEFTTRGIARILATADLDFCVIDLEHTGSGHQEIADQMAWFAATDIAPFVRVPSADYHWIARTMDVGALGVMVPNVETADQAARARDAMKYLPLGKRGVGLGGALTEYRRPDPAEFFRRSNENTTLICQIESTKGMANLEEIARVEGVDCLWVGHFDLSNSMGIPAQFHNAEFLAALKTVVETAKKHGKTAGIQPGDMAQAEQWLGIGFNVISWNSDHAVYGRALRAEVGALREAMGRG